MYSQLLYYSSVNPWYIVEAGAGIVLGGTSGGAGVAAFTGVGGVGFAGAASSPVVGFAAGVGRGSDGGAVAPRSATWRAMMAAAVSNSSSASEYTSSDIDVASVARVSGAGSLPFLDVCKGGFGGGCAGLLEEGWLTSSSPRIPPGLAGRFLARSIILGTDDEGVGAAKETLRPSRGLRVGRGRSFAGPFVCAVIMALNLRISAEISW